ncbi:MAG: TOMM precursor leader peptide-binding protein [Ktedonobacteraceae bacterium]
MTKDSSFQLSHLRPDVSIWQRNGTVYLVTSQGLLRLRHSLSSSGKSATIEVNERDFFTALTPQIVEELQRRDMLLRDDKGLRLHPLYQTITRNGDPSFAIVDKDLGRSIEGLLHGLELPTIMVATESRTLDGASIAVVPLSLDEDQLKEWSAMAARQQIHLVVYLATPTRLLLSVLDPFLTPCMVCLARRLRATYRAQEISDIPLERLFGASSDAAWPTDALSTAHIGHAALLNCTPKRSTPPSIAQLLEIDYTRFEIHRHPLLRLPNCPGCSAEAPYVSGTEHLLDADEGWTDLAESWKRMQPGVDPLIGIVASVQAHDRSGIGGSVTMASTTGHTNTLWISPVEAQATGFSAKHDPLLAKASALGEAYERYACGIYNPESFVRGTLKQLDPLAIDPRSLPLGSEREYQKQKGPLVPYHPDLEIDWVKGISLVTHAPRLVPACSVYVPYKAPRPEEHLLYPISTGLAAGATQSEATLAGLYEIIERDAFVIFWENALTAPTLDFDTLPQGPSWDIIEQCQADGIKIICKLITTDIGVPAVVVHCVQWTEEGPLVAFSSRANLNFARCLQGSLEELMQCREGTRSWIKKDGVPPDGKPLRQMQDFFTYYSREDRLEYLSFMYEGPVVPAPHSEADYPTATAAVREVVKRLDRRGYETIVVDITPVDVAACGTSVIRSIVPGLQPVTFNRNFRHLGGRRLYEAPVWMGLRSQSLQEDQLNPHPMPAG